MAVAVPSGPHFAYGSMGMIGALLFLGPDDPRPTLAGLGGQIPSGFRGSGMVWVAKLPGRQDGLGGRKAQEAVLTSLPHGAAGPP